MITSMGVTEQSLSSYKIALNNHEKDNEKP
jgi:hypothetical protein